MSDDGQKPQRLTIPEDRGPLPLLEPNIGRVKAMLQVHGYLGVIVIDLEPLSHIENEFGSDAYSQLILDIGTELVALRNQVVRSSDLICSARPDGEQVAIFLDGARKNQELSPGAIELITDRIWLALVPRIAELLRPFGSHARVRLGYSVVLLNSMINADRLIYRALDQARAMVADHTRRVDTRAREQLRDLIVRRQLTTAFQPIVEMPGTKILAYEALIRGPVGTDMSSPAMLFNLAQQADLVAELDRACCNCNLTRAGAGALPTSALLFANVLPTVINDPTFRRWLIDTSRSLFDGRLVLELNEGVAIKNHDMLSRGIAELRDGGIRIALDDLGAGYANLDHVLRLKPDFLKLDISLVRGVDRSEVKQALISSLVSVGRAAQSVVIAEGVEEQAECEMLQTLGVPWGQGFLFARPNAEFVEASSLAKA